MPHARIIESTNEFPYGPIGYEYLLPVDPETASKFSPWLQPLATFSADDVFSELSRQWTPTNYVTRPMVDFFSILGQASLYVLPALLAGIAVRLLSRPVAAERLGTLSALTRQPIA